MGNIPVKSDYFENNDNVESFLLVGILLKT